MSGDRLPAETSVGRVRLRVANLQRSRDFYGGHLGLSEFNTTFRAVEFGPKNGHAIVHVEEMRGTRSRPEGTNGLYHFAILFPDRASLARAIIRLQQLRWPFQGFSDHGVSEAAYLADPDGNGIELYVDRPRSQWPGSEGRLIMFSKPLDLGSLLSEAEPASDGIAPPPATRMGHVHLHVSDLTVAERFWVGVIGFDVVTRDYPGALFVAAGGYHHHLGLNTWARNRQRPDDVAGLLDFVIHTGSQEERDAVLRRAQEAGIAYTDTNEGAALQDLEGNRVIIAI